MFARCQPQVTGKVARRAEPRDIPDKTDHGGGRQQSDAGQQFLVWGLVGESAERASDLVPFGV